MLTVSPELALICNPFTANDDVIFKMPPAFNFIVSFVIPDIELEYIEQIPVEPELICIDIFLNPSLTLNVFVI